MTEVYKNGNGEECLIAYDCVCHIYIFKWATTPVRMKTRVLILRIVLIGRRYNLACVINTPTPESGLVGCQ